MMFSRLGEVISLNSSLHNRSINKEVHQHRVDYNTVGESALGFEILACWKRMLNHHHTASQCRCRRLITTISNLNPISWWYLSDNWNLMNIWLVASWLKAATWDLTCERVWFARRGAIWKEYKYSAKDETNISTWTIFEIWFLFDRYTFNELQMVSILLIQMWYRKLPLHVVHGFGIDYDGHQLKIDLFTFDGTFLPEFSLQCSLLHSIIRVMC